MGERLRGKRPELDVHQDSAAEIREADAIAFGLECRNPDACRTETIAPGDNFRDAAVREPAKRRCRQFLWRRFRANWSRSTGASSGLIVLSPIIAHPTAPFSVMAVP